MGGRVVASRSLRFVSIMAFGAAFVVLMVVCGGVVAADDANPLRDPADATDALRLFQSATRNSRPLQAQRAMHWIQNNYVQVLRAKELATVTPECLLQILSQPVDGVAEIEVFRAVRRLVEFFRTDDRCYGRTEARSPKNNRIPLSVLLSTVRFLDIDEQQFRSEVIASKIVPKIIIDELENHFKQSQAVVPAVYRRQLRGGSESAKPQPSSSFSFVAPPFVNVLAPGNKPVIRAGTNYTLSATCPAGNPLISAADVDQDCWVESPASEYVTIDLPDRYFIRMVYMFTAAHSDRQCNAIRVETSADGRNFALAFIENGVCTGCGLGLEVPREVQSIRYKVDGHCQRPDGSPVQTVRVTGLQAYYYDP